MWAARRYCGLDELESAARNSETTRRPNLRRHTGQVAEWSNAPDSKSGVLGFQYRGFESLPARHATFFNFSIVQIADRNSLI